VGGKKERYATRGTRLTGKEGNIESLGDETAENQDRRKSEIKASEFREGVERSTTSLTSDKERNHGTSHGGEIGGKGGKGPEQQGSIEQSRKESLTAMQAPTG